jgi:hypothetical protein
MSLPGIPTVVKSAYTHHVTSTLREQLCCKGAPTPLHQALKFTVSVCATHSDHQHVSSPAARLLCFAGGNSCKRMF